MRNNYSKSIWWHIFIVFALFHNALAQYRLELDTVYTSNISSFTSIIELDQGRLAIAGYEVTEAPSWAYQMSLNIIDTNGIVELDTSFAGRGFEVASQIHQLPDDNLILIGQTGIDFSNTYDIGVKKLSISGDTLWTRHFDQGGFEAPVASAITPDGLIAITGTQRIGDYEPEDAWLYLLDTLGQVTLTSVFGGDKEDYPRDMLVTTEGEVIITGGTRSFNSTNGDGWLYALDPNGDSLWMYTFGGTKSEVFSSMCMSPTGTFILAGTMDNDLWLLETDSSGTVLNENIFGGRSTDNSLKIIPAPAGGYYLLAFTASYGSLQGDAWVLKLGSDLYPEWSSVLGSPVRDNIFGMTLTSTNNLLLGGRHGVSDDAWLMRISQEPNKPPGDLELLGPAPDSTLVLDAWPSPEDSLTFNWSPATDPDTLNIYPQLEYRLSISSSAWGDTVISTGVSQSISLPLLPIVQAMIDSLRMSESITWTVLVTDHQSSTEATNGPFTLSIEAPTLDVDDNSAFIPEGYLLQNYPNPFNPSTTLRFGLVADTNISLVVYDVRGQVVQTIETGQKSAGEYTVTWNGTSTDGHTLATGVYFAKLTAGAYSQVVKMLYLK